MPTEIITAIISLAGSLIGTLSGIAVSSKLTAYRIEQLEKKVEKHNSIVERIYELEKNVAVLDDKIKSAQHRLDDIEKDVH